MIAEDVHPAETRDDKQRAQTLLHVLHHDFKQHPETRLEP